MGRQAKGRTRLALHEKKKEKEKEKEKENRPMRLLDPNYESVGSASLYLRHRAYAI
jgi:hypothetical protein